MRIIDPVAYAVLGPAHSTINWQEVEQPSRRNSELVSKI